MKTMTRSLAIASAVVLMTTEAFPQWTPTNGPSGGNVTSMVASGTSLFACSSAGVLVSQDGGSSWSTVTNGLPVGYCTVLAADNPNILVNFPGIGSYYSLDNGMSWHAIGSDLPSFVNCGAIGNNNTPAGDWFAGVFGGVLHRYGAAPDTFRYANAGLPHKNVTSLLVSGEYVYAVDSGRVYHTLYFFAGGDSTWKDANVGLPNGVSKIASTWSADGFTETLFANPYGHGVYVSTVNIIGDVNSPWTSRNAGLADSTTVFGLYASGDTVYAVSQLSPSASVIYFTTDNGVSWNHAGTFSGIINGLIVTGGKVLAATSSGLYTLSQSPGPWQTSISQFWGPESHVLTFVPFGSSMLQAAANGIYSSTDKGATWSPLITTLSGSQVDYLAVSGQAILGASLIGTGFSCAFTLTTDGGASWYTKTEIIGDTVFGILMNPPGSGPLKLFAATGGGGVMASSDFGASWKSIGLQSRQVYGLTMDTSGLYAATDTGVYALPTGDTVWVKAGAFFAVPVTFLSMTGGKLFAGSRSGGLYQSVDHGQFWTQSGYWPSSHVTSISPGIVTSSSGVMTMYLGLSQGGVQVSEDNGAHWSDYSAGLPFLDVSSVAVVDSTLFAGTYFDGAYIRRAPMWTAVQPGVAASTVGALIVNTNGTDIVAGTYDNGIALYSSNVWSSPLSGPPPGNEIRAFAQAGGQIFAGIAGIAGAGGISASADAGNTWTDHSNGLGGTSITALTSIGPQIVAGGAGVFVSTDLGGSWVQTPSSNPSPIYSVVCAYQTGNPDPLIYAGAIGAVYKFGPAPVWTISLSQQSPFDALAVADSIVYAGLSGGAYYLSKDSTGWDSLDNGLTISSVKAFAVVDTFLLAGTGGGGVFATGVHQNQWMAINQNLPGVAVLSLVANSTTLYAGTSGLGMWKRSLQDVLAHIAPQFLMSQMISHTGLFSFNGGQNITGVSINFSSLTGSGPVTVEKFTNGPENVAFSGTPPSNTSGYRWVITSSGIASFSATVSIDLSTLTPGIALPESVIVYKRPTIGSGQLVALPTTYDPVNHLLQATISSFSEFVLGSNSPLTGVSSQKALPRVFSLVQNYPNPFNPSTTISYQLPKTSFVTIKVFDILGQEIATLVNEMEVPGSYALRWNATKFASGVYFYRITAGSFVSTKKMVLLK